MKNQALVALLIMLTIQAYVSMVAVAVPVLAPEIAASTGLSTALVGVFVAMVYSTSSFSGLVGGSAAGRFGSIRVSQIAVTLAALGVACMLGPWMLMIFAPLVIGLGYGPITPASSHLLIRTTPPHQVAFTFSLKQTGVPAGAALAGALLPALSLAFGWRAALVAVVLFGAVLLVISQPIRASLDVDLQPHRLLSLEGVFGPLREYLGNPSLRELGRSGCMYAITQSCVMSFLVSYLATEIGISLIAAGLALTAASVGAVVGRIIWGAAADRWIAPRALLGALGIVSGACGIATSQLTPDWPHTVVLALCGLYGAVAIGWNGVSLSEVARAAPPGRAGAITGASTFITFTGVVFGPPLFGLLLETTKSHRTGFLLLAGLSLLNGLLLLARHGARWRHRA